LECVNENKKQSEKLACFTAWQIMVASGYKTPYEKHLELMGIVEPKTIDKEVCEKAKDTQLSILKKVHKL
jgi:hypothetical protein